MSYVSTTTSSVPQTDLVPWRGEDHRGLLEFQQLWPHLTWQCESPGDTTPALLPTVWSNKSVAHLKTLLRKHGLVIPVVAGPTGDIEIGHRTAQVAYSLGWTQLPTILGATLPLSIRQLLQDIDEGLGTQTHSIVEAQLVARIHAHIQEQLPQTARWTTRNTARWLRISRHRVEESIAISAAMTQFPVLQQVESQLGWKGVQAASRELEQQTITPEEVCRLLSRISREAPRVQTQAKERLPWILLRTLTEQELAHPVIQAFKDSIETQTGPAATWGRTLTVPDAQRLWNKVQQRPFDDHPFFVLTGIPVRVLHAIQSFRHPQEKARSGRPREYYGHLTKSQRTRLMYLLAFGANLEEIVTLTHATPNQIVTYLQNNQPGGIRVCPGCHQPWAWNGVQARCVQCKSEEGKGKERAENETESRKDDPDQTETTQQ